MVKIKLLIVIIALVALIVSIVALSFPKAIPTGSVAGKQDEVKLRVGGHNTMLSVVLEIAKEKGFYAREGLDVEIERVESSKITVPAMARGDLDIIIASISAGSFNALEKNSDFRIIADASRVLPSVIVRRDLAGKMSGIADLKGKTIMIPREGSASYYALQKILNSTGLEIGDVVTRYLEEREAITAMEVKNIDAAILNEPYATYAVEKRIGIRFGQAEISEIFPEEGQQHMFLLSTTRLTKDKPDVLKKFLMAYADAAQFYNHAKAGVEPERSGVVRIVSEYTGIEPEIVNKSAWIGIDDHARPEIGYLREVQEYWYANGLIKEKVLDERTDLRFLPG